MNDKPVALSERSEEWLKAAAYDQMVMMQSIQNNIRLINEELSKRQTTKGKTTNSVSKPSAAPRTTD